MHKVIAIVCLTALGACDVSAFKNTGINFTDITADDGTSFDAALNDFERSADAAYRDLPFETGVVHVLANEHGDLHTYTLTPCRSSTRICGGTGRVGQVERTEDFFVVTGAYRDRTFYLSPGGDGYLTWRGINRDLAWN